MTTSVDAFVDGVHFRRETAPRRSIGRKALASALSDLAAMGAEPGEAYVTIGIPIATLADRIILFSARPGRIKAMFEVDFARPRDAV